jgi:FtsZ-interacting cell division protein YlmF
MKKIDGHNRKVNLLVDFQKMLEEDSTYSYQSQQQAQSPHHKHSKT